MQTLSSASEHMSSWSSSLDTAASGIHSCNGVPASIDPSASSAGVSKPKLSSNVVSKGLGTDALRFSFFFFLGDVFSLGLRSLSSTIHASSCTGSEAISTAGASAMARSQTGLHIMVHNACSTSLTRLCSMPDTEEGSIAQISFHLARGSGTRPLREERKSGSTHCRSWKKSTLCRKVSFMAITGMLAGSTNTVDGLLLDRPMCHVNSNAVVNSVEEANGSGDSPICRPRWLMNVCFSKRA
mmetsp:Transcript_86654/g.223194  ORF Transcript_86654/g.223194 Transcript_86654/m.223194 type:complete len:241 (-) Transcript_86654:230-952(-)